MIQIKRGYPAAWASEAGTLAEGQPGIEIQPKRNLNYPLDEGELRVGKIGGGTFSDAIRVLPRYYSYDLSKIYPSSGGFEVYIGAGYLKLSTDDGFIFKSTVPQATALSFRSSLSFPNRTKGATFPENTNPTIECTTRISSSNEVEHSFYIGAPWIPKITDIYELGNILYKWDSVWAVSGNIQTSGKKSKTNIKSVLDVNNAISSPGAVGPEFEGQASNSYPPSNITINDLVDCLKKIDPVTFNYLDKNNKPNEHSHAIQLGLIADDILEANSNVFKYIGTKETIKKPNPEKYHQNITEAENFGEWVDKEGNVINEYELPEEDYITEDELGLQPLPVATMALAINKHLLNEIDKLKEEISELKSKLNN